LGLNISTTEGNRIPREAGILMKVSELRWKLGNKAKLEQIHEESKPKEMQDQETRRKLIRLPGKTGTALPVSKDESTNECFKVRRLSVSRQLEISVTGSTREAVNLRLYSNVES
jgi:hypothetical protein